MNDSGFKINCPRCGGELDSNARYCMKCGYINANNEANKNMAQYLPKEQVSSYQIGSGQVIVQSESNNTSIATNTGNKTACFLLNFIVYLLIIFVGFFVSAGGSNLTIVTIKNSIFPYIAFLASLLFLHLYSWELIYMKCNRPWWAVLIPIYNIIVLGDILYNKKWVGILTLIPIVGQILLLVMLYTLGKRFKYNGLLTIILSLVIIPLMGFGAHFYNNTDYVDKEHSLEMTYKLNKTFLGFILVLFLIGFAFIFWNNIVEVKSSAQKLSNYYYVYVTNKTIDKTKQLIDENYLDCGDYRYSDNEGRYYVYYPDVGQRVFIPFYHLKEDLISAYVIIDNTGGGSKYYISMSDGTYGYPETLYDDINNNMIVKYKEIIQKSEDEIVHCEITKNLVTVGEM